MAARRNVMRVPGNMTRSHVIRAMDRIGREGVPDKRRATLWQVRYRGRGYPPKYVISVANIFANCSELSHKRFQAQQARAHLGRLGFEVRPL